jgi:23S rRNA pseudouridine2605 synthase
MANERSAPRRVDGKSSNRVGGKSNNRSETKSGFRSGGKPSYSSDRKGGPRSDGSTPPYRSDKRTDSKPAYRSDKPGARPGDKPHARPDSKTGTRPDGKPVYARIAKPFGGKRRDSRTHVERQASNRPSPKTDGRIRLNKYLADCGIASRRAADQIIADGEITINGKKVYELGVKVDPRQDRILYKGKPLQATNQFVYYAFNKPRSVVTSTVDPQGRPTVIDFFPKSKFRLFPVGRLDWDSEGLIFITNDGEFAQRVIHPHEHVPKTYHVKLNGIPNDIHLDKLKKGVSIVGGKVAALHIRRMQKSTDTKGWIEITIGEGKNHQIRLMFAKIGFDVIKLRRVAIGEFKLGSLEPGKHKELTHEDLSKIFKKRKPKELSKES